MRCLNQSVNKLEEKMMSSHQLIKLQESDLKLTHYRWIELYTHLHNRPELADLLFNNSKLLFLSRQRLLRTPNVDSLFKEVFLQFDSQTCLKALSTIRDLSDVKLNQYKFMYRNFTLGKAIRILISESFFLYRNLMNKSNEAENEFKRLVGAWVHFIMLIHKVPEDAIIPLTRAIFESVQLRISSKKYQVKLRNPQNN